MTKHTEEERNDFVIVAYIIISTLMRRDYHHGFAINWEMATINLCHYVEW